MSWDLSFSLMFYKGFMLMTVTSFTELKVFSCFSFNILNEDLSGKVDKMSSITFKYTIHKWIRLELDYSLYLEYMYVILYLGSWALLVTDLVLSPQAIVEPKIHFSIWKYSTVNWLYILYLILQWMKLVQYKIQNILSIKWLKQV